eukprot:COSAG01_NODE_13326_length_1600_cov_5.213191_2_plen_280_part_00
MAVCLSLLRAIDRVPGKTGERSPTRSHALPSFTGVADARTRGGACLAGPSNTWGGRGGTRKQTGFIHTRTGCLLEMPQQPSAPLLNARVGRVVALGRLRQLHGPQPPQRGPALRTVGSQAPRRRTAILLHRRHNNIISSISPTNSGGASGGSVESNRDGAPHTPCPLHISLALRLHDAQASEFVRTHKGEATDSCCCRSRASACRDVFLGSLCACITSVSHNGCTWLPSVRGQPEHWTQLTLLNTILPQRVPQLPACDTLVLGCHMPIVPSSEAGYSLC